MIDPRLLLDRIIALIDRDMVTIEQLPGKIPHEDVLDLTRYSSALLDIISQKDEDIQKEKERLSKLSHEQLKTLAKEILSKEK